MATHAADEEAGSLCLTVRDEQWEERRALTTLAERQSLYAVTGDALQLLQLLNESAFCSAAQCRSVCSHEATPEWSGRGSAGYEGAVSSAEH